MIYSSEEKERSTWVKLLWFRIPFRLLAAILLFTTIMPAFPIAIQERIAAFTLWASLIGIPTSIAISFLLHRLGYTGKDRKVMFFAMVESCAKVILFPLVVPAYLMHLWGYEPSLACAFSLSAVAGYAAFELYVELAYLKYTVFVREINIRLSEDIEEDPVVTSS